MRLLFWLAVLMPVAASGAERPVRAWLAGDPFVTAWPAAPVSVAGRVKQAEEGGLRWMVVSNRLLGSELERPGLGRVLATQETKLRVLHGVRWRTPPPLTVDLVCLGVDSMLPLRAHRAQSIIDWAHLQGGAAIVTAPEKALSHDVAGLRRLAAFQAYRDGSWHPACTRGGEWDQLLARGFRLCIVGSAGGPRSSKLGRQAVVTYLLAESGEPAAVLAALAAGRTAVSEGGSVRLGLTVNGAPLGGVAVAKNDRVTAVVTVDADRVVESVDLIGNVNRHDEEGLHVRTVVLQSIPIRAKKATREVTLRLGQGTAYLRAEAVTRRPVERTLTSPILLGDAPGPPDPATLEKVRASVRLTLDGLAWDDGDAVRRLVSQLFGREDLGTWTAVHMARTLSAPQLKMIRPLVTAPTRRVRALAAYVVTRRAGREAARDLYPLVKDPGRWGLRTYGARLLCRVAGPEQEEILNWLSWSPDGEVRRVAIMALARTPSALSLERLRRALTDLNPAVQRCAETHLVLALGVDPARSKPLLNAFREGTVEAEKLATLVPDKKLRKRAAEVIALKLGPHKRPEIRDVPPPLRRGSEPRRVPVRRVRTGPTVDGQPTDPLWQAAKSAGQFVTPARQYASRQTAVRAVCDDKALYLLFECEEPKPTQLVAEVKERDRHVWQDDSVEAWLVPSGLRGERVAYYRFVANPIGTRFDERRRAAAWNGVWQTAGTVGRDRWFCEMRIPYATLDAQDPPKRGDVWLVNFIRRRKVLPEEESSFSLCIPRDITNFAELVFQ
jgi:hypothetical protein